MKELPRNKDGKKLYPVCSWERHQHKVYTAHDKMMVMMARAKDKPLTDDERRWCNKVDVAYDSFDAHVREGIVYATWEEGCAIKDIIYGWY